jgi:endonuclease/exonuclease/phosphatase family metal-dependent hydrolase
MTDVHVRVMTYNIYMGGRRGAAVVDVVRRAQPDVLLVNECPKRWLLWKRDCRTLAEACRMRMVAGGRPGGSNLVAAAPGVGVKHAGAEVLPQPLLQPRRGIAWAQLRVSGRLLGVVSCHLSLDRAGREHETTRVIEVAGSLRGPVVVAGDLNEPPSGPCWSRLRDAGFVDHGSDRWRTFPAEAPSRRIDALLVRGGPQVLQHGDPGVPTALLAAASDHRPVLGVLDL